MGMGKYSISHTLQKRRLYKTFSDDDSYWDQSWEKWWTDYQEWSSDVIRTRPSFLFGKKWRPPTDWSHGSNKYIIEPGRLEYSQWDPYRERTEYVTETGLDMGVLVNDFNDLHWDYCRAGIQNTDSHKKAVTECLVKLGEGKVQLGQFIAEAKQSAEMLTDSGIAFLELLHKVRRGQWNRIPKDWMSIKNGIGDGLLQWNYGWKPLASDLYEMHADLTGKLKDRGLLVHAKRQVKDTWSFDSPDEYRMTVQGGKVSVKHTDTCQLTAKVTDKLVADATSYGLTNPLSLGWELVPYSFVVDWFMPIGNTLQALTATNGLEFVGGFHSQKKEGTIEIAGRVGKATRKIEYFDRVAYNSFPSPSFYAVKNPLTPTRAANLLALINQFFR